MCLDDWTANIISVFGLVFHDFDILVSLVIQVIPLTSSGCPWQVSHPLFWVPLNKEQVWANFKSVSRDLMIFGVMSVDWHDR